MGISDTLVGIASDTASKSGSGLASISQGVGQGIQQFSQLAELAQRKEQLEMQKQATAQKSKELESAKLDKFVSAMEKGGSLKGSARSNYYNKVLPQYRDALNLTDKFSNESLQFATSSPETLARAKTLIADARAGKITEQQAIAAFNDPVALMNVPPSIDEAEDFYAELGKSGESALDRTGAEKRARITADSKANQIQANVDKEGREIENAAIKKSNEKIGEEHSNYMAVGGSSTMKANIESLRSLADQVEKTGVSDKAKAASYSGSKKLMDLADPKLAAIKNQVEAIGVTNLKATFGGNPTEGEREALLGTLFPERLGAKEIAKRLRQEADRAAETVKNKEFQFKRLNLPVSSSAPAAPTADKSARYKELLGRAKTPADRQKIIDSAKKQGISLGGK